MISQNTLLNQGFFCFTLFFAASPFEAEGADSIGSPRHVKGGDKASATKNHLTNHRNFSTKNHPTKNRLFCFLDVIIFSRPSYTSSMICGIKGCDFA